MDSRLPAASDALRRISLHPSLVEPVLLAGADRELVLVNGILAAALVFGVGFSWMTLGLAALLLTFGHWALVRLASFDPQFRETYLRHIHLRDLYLAQADEGAPSSSVQASVPETR